jgi:hypothetical protein
VSHPKANHFFIGNFDLGVFEQKRKGTPLGKSAKKFEKIYALVIVHKVKIL